MLNTLQVKNKFRIESKRQHNLFQTENMKRQYFYILIIVQLTISKVCS